jgi:peptide/nickel transport system permease protein
MIPGSIIDLMIEEHSRVGEEVNRADVEKTLGLDKPIHIQYGNWMAGIFRGDLGRSLWTERRVTREIMNRLPVSFELGLLAIVIALLISIPIGVYSAVRQDTGGDYVARSFAIACIALPSFWVGTMVVVFPSIWWHWSPPVRLVPFAEDPLANLGMFIIPSAILGMVLSGTTMRMTRTMMLEVLRQDYIRTAWSKGLKERVVILRHAMKNAMIPVITIIGLQLPVTISGSVVLEKIFCLPGIGWLIIDAINSRDYAIISGINLFLATFVLIINLFVDVTYAWLDPRVQYR